MAIGFKRNKPIRSVSQAETQGIIEQPQPEKRGIFKRLGEAFGTTMERPTDKGLEENVDEYGIIRPQQEKAGIGKKALEFLLPTLFSAFGGAGVIPGLAVGMGAQAARRGRNVEAEQEYSKARAAAAMNQARLKAETTRPNVGMTKLYDEKKYLDIQRRAQQEKRQGLKPGSLVRPEEAEWANSYFDLKMRKKSEEVTVDDDLEY